MAAGNIQIQINMEDITNSPLNNWISKDLHSFAKFAPNIRPDISSIRFKKLLKVFIQSFRALFLFCTVDLAKHVFNSMLQSKILNKKVDYSGSKFPRWNFKVNIKRFFGHKSSNNINNY